MKIFSSSLLRAFLAGIFFLGVFPTTGPAKVFSEVPTGLMELDGLKYPVLLYVPDQYDPEKPFPMVISFAGDKQTLEQHMAEWKGTADRRSLVVVVPTLLLPRDGSVPFRVDEWILEIKNKIQTRYRVAKGRTYLMGRDSSANYVAYLGSAHGDKFGGVALMNGAWEGPLKQVAKPQKSVGEQPPFFVSFDSDHEDAMNLAKPVAAEYAERGYILQLELIEADETYESGKFKRRMLDWLEHKAEKWKALEASEDKNLKRKLKKWFERNTKVK